MDKQPLKTWERSIRKIFPERPLHLVRVFQFERWTLYISRGSDGYCSARLGGCEGVGWTFKEAMSNLRGLMVKP